MTSKSSGAASRHGFFIAGLRDSLSIAIGYIPVAISFGLAAIYAGMSPALALMTSLFVYAGASQFILLSLLASGGAPASVIGIVCSTAPPCLESWSRAKGACPCLRWPWG
jgi:predicted branched-subunit amino acid permease